MADTHSLALALDTPDIAEATHWAECVKGLFGVVKVGLELFSSFGPGSIEIFQSLGFQVFVDLKFHDIPATVEKASRVIGSLGASYMTVHTSGGVNMVEAARIGLRDGCAKSGAIPTRLLGVTVLTSEKTASEDLLLERVEILKRAGADGLVCATSDLEVVRRAASGLIKVVPGIRRDIDAQDDQSRVSGPERAIASGADILVVGRPITQAVDPRREAENFANLVRVSQE